MKTKIKVKVLTDYLNSETGETSLPIIKANGEWIDLRAADDIKFEAPRVLDNKVIFDTKLVDLCTAIKLPEGYEAVMDPRSSLPKLNLFQTNSQGVIDNCYNGNNDRWKLWLTALGDTEIHKGDRICQFRIQLSQKATFLQKLGWLFHSGVEIIEVDNLNDTGRGGFGTSGLN